MVASLESRVEEAIKTLSPASKSKAAQSLRTAVKQWRRAPDQPRALISLAECAFRANERDLGWDCVQRFLESITRCEPADREFWFEHFMVWNQRARQRSAESDGDDRAFEGFYLNLLRFGYGLDRAAQLGVPRASWGEPLPLYSYPLIEYLLQLDFSRCDVFEFGAGSSTLFWSKRSRSVTAVETDERWHRELGPKLGKRSELLLVPQDVAHRAIERVKGSFDIIIIDGGFNRYESARSAIPRLKKKGMMIVDNAEWYPRTCELLRSKGLIQVDFVGLRPSQYRCGITSAFLSRSCDFQPLGGRQPSFGIGTIPRDSAWDLPFSAPREQVQTSASAIAPAPRRARAARSSSRPSSRRRPAAIADK